MLLVIVSETSATSTLKMFGSSEGMSKMLLLGLLVLLYCTCYYSLSRAVKDIPVGLAYATWSGTGILWFRRWEWRFTASIRTPPPLSVWRLSPAGSLS
jgi:multidrug transporter EmrE-like cation transporter